jgi:hypothetical protein
MASRNPITNDEIKSRGYSKQGRDNFRRIFEKKTFSEWVVEEAVDNLKDSFTDDFAKITYQEFLKKVDNLNK